MATTLYSNQDAQVYDYTEWLKSAYGFAQLGAQTFIANKQVQAGQDPSNTNNSLFSSGGQTAVPLLGSVQNSTIGIVAVIAVVLILIMGK